MMRSMRTVLVGIAAIVALSTAATFSQSAATSKTRTYVETLASERFAGREAGSPGARLGVKPLPGRDSVFLPFEFTAGSRDGGSRVAIGTSTFNAPQDVLSLSFS